ncbi:MAG: acetyltransferase component of pyruvate dehydrogenase complex [Phycisphaeraceae bacterium]|nr:MAG: acetyltransferase component of pyruvate dehydrogenase complex [Phycisphaeraceae bacterium]
MPIEITMPRLSDTMEQGTVVKWNIAEGDSVSSGDVIADIETDKATMELQSFDDGTVAKLPVAEGEQVAVGTVIAVLAEDGESAADAAKGASSGAPKNAAKAESGSDSSGPATATATEAPSKPSNGTAAGAPNNGSSNGSTSTEGGRIFASPLARKLAAEKGVDLGALAGSGPSGRIVKRDVESAAGSGATAPRAESGPLVAGSVTAAPPFVGTGAGLEDRAVELSNMRATIAKRLVESKTTIPHYQVTMSARLDALMELREQLNDQLEPQGVKLSVNDFLVRACAIAMHEHPFINSSWVESGPKIQLHGHVNVGVAIALPQERGGGLVVATLRDADRIGLRQISAETKRLAKKARDKGLTIDEMSDSTFTISNLGMFGVDHFTAIINPPNACILAVGRAIEKPFIERNDEGEAELVLGHEMSMTISSDHRVVDGAMAAQYLNSVKQLLENPATLLV